jgi:RimJ/RimL family protein N-acetyltransferase
MIGAIRKLETARLILRPLEVADAEQTQRIFPQWEIVRFLAPQVPWPYPEDGAIRYYRDVALPAMASGAEWHWSLRLKTAPNNPIGAIGLFATGDSNRGFWLGLQWQGLGLMTEASEAANEFWFREIGSPILRVSKAVANTASSRISAKNGMRLIGREEREYVGGRFPTEIWEMTAAEWRAHRGRLDRISV